MDELTERIRVSIENRNGDPWFPELTADLATRAWEGLRQDIGITPNIYGTERVLSHSISAPRHIVRSLVMPVHRSAASATSIETLSRECAAEYKKKGVSFYSPAEIQTTDLYCIEEALAIINQVPSMLRTVSVLVRSLHLIKPADEAHDVSFSEPHVPFSIFVSVSNKRKPDDKWRMAEAIVHEAMHLQLTLIEQIIPLVQTTQRKYFSPWRATYRPVQGVLHGLYVFRVIDSFLARLSVLGSASRYVEDRRRVINNQILEAQSLQNSADLTMDGDQLIRRLMCNLNSHVHKTSSAS